MPRVPITKISPVSGFLSGHNPPRRNSFYWGLAISVLIWIVTPAGWATVLWHYYRTGSILTLPTRGGFLAKFWYLNSLAEIPFSIYLQYLTYRAGRRNPPPEASLETLQLLLTRSLTVGLQPSEDGPQLRNRKVDSSKLPANGSAQQLRGMQALRAKQIDEEEAAHRRERLRAWFFFAEIDEIYEDNVREWLAWAFTGRHLEEAKGMKTCSDLIDEGLEMVKLRLDWPHMKKGYNPKVRAIRLTLDPVRVMSRPFGYYVVTNGVTFGTTAWLCAWHGFRFEFSGRCTFLVKPAERKRSSSSSKKSLPIVFMHGLGIGLGQYIPMLTELGKHKDGVVILIQPHISTGIYSPHFLEPPSKDEQADATIDILRKHKFERCTTLSHSNGTMVLGWILRKAPEMFVKNVLADPVSFCLWEGSVCYSFIYRRWATGVEVLLGYCVARELGIAHTIGRQFIWFDMILWAEEIPSWKPEDLHIIFAERDMLVDVPGSVRYLREAGIPDECISVLHNYQHGQALMHKGEGMAFAMQYAGLRTR